jgi:hypothetical protein
MQRNILLLSTALAMSSFAPALAQEGEAVTIVLGEDIDLVEPCMATRSNIGRIIMQNVNKTLTQFDVKGDEGVMPRSRSRGRTKATAPGGSTCARVWSSRMDRPSTPTTSSTRSSGR